MRMTVEECQKSICGLMKRHEALKVKDLNSLSGCQMVQRAHGGAVAIHSESDEPPYTIREREMREEKQQIGLTAASLVGRRGMILVDTVSTSSRSFGASPIRKASPPSSTGFRLSWS